MARPVPYTYASLIGNVSKIDWNNLVSHIGTTYVPYTGATTNVDLGNYNLTAKEMTVGNGSVGHDPKISFNGQDNDGEIMFQEDENWFKVNKTIYMPRNLTGNQTGLDINIESVDGNATGIYVYGESNFASKGGIGIQTQGFAYNTTAYAIAADLYSEGSGNATLYGTYLTGLVSGGSGNCYAHYIRNSQITTGGNRYGIYLDDEGSSYLPSYFGGNVNINATTGNRLTLSSPDNNNDNVLAFSKNGGSTAYFKIKHDTDDNLIEFNGTTTPLFMRFQDSTSYVVFPSSVSVGYGIESPLTKLHVALDASPLPPLTLPDGTSMLFTRTAGGGSDKIYQTFLTDGESGIYFGITSAPDKAGISLIGGILGLRNNSAIALDIDGSNNTNVKKNLTIGDGTADTDFTLTFNGETNDGVLTWKEDENYFEFSDSVNLEDSSKKYQIGGFNALGWDGSNCSQIPNCLDVGDASYFNTTQTDNDFIIYKKTSGTAYAYDAGLDTHTFNSSIYIPSDTMKYYLGAGNDMSIDYNGTIGNIKTDLVAASDLHIDCGTEKTVVLDEPIWVDIDFPIIIRTTGNGIPTLQTLSGNITAPQWQVGDYNQCEGQELIHSWQEGTDLYFHVHCITNGLDTSNRYLKFEIELLWANLNGVLSGTTITSTDLLIPANTTDRTHLLFSINTYTPTSGKIGAHVYARLKRVASTGTAPTNDPFCSMLQAHIKCDTIGSRQIGIK